VKGNIIAQCSIHTSQYSHHYTKSPTDKFALCYGTWQYMDSIQCYKTY